MNFRKKKKQTQFEKVDVKKEEVEEKNPMKEITEETKEVKEKIIVVKELPTQPVRQAKAEDGTLITYITVEEALTEFMNEEDNE